MLSHSVEETHKIAKGLLDKLKDRNVICLYGQLGAGKTTFVQGLAKGLGIKKRVISPTFVLVREYKIATSYKQQETRNQNLQLATCNLEHLIHIDCYRINSEKDIKSIDLGEFWSERQNLVVIEWAEKIKKILPKKRIDIKFDYVDEKKRKINIATSCK